MTDETTGYLSEKWSNKKDDGTDASNTANDGAETDYPLFRLSDVYLMYAECVARIKGTSWDDWNGGTDASDPAVIASRKKGAIYWINLVRERAGASDVWNSNFADDNALQRVAHVHHLLASLLAVGILCHAGINLTVQVEFGKECIGCALGSLTVRTWQA